MPSVSLLFLIHFCVCYILFVYFYLIKLFVLRVYVARRGFNIYNSNLRFNYLNINFQMYLWYQWWLVATLKCGFQLSYFIDIWIFVLFLVFLIFSSSFVLLMRRMHGSFLDSEVIFFALKLFFLVLSGLFFSRDFGVFFLNLEVASVIFYLFFLTYLRTKFVSLVKYKNMIGSYVWGTFFSTVLYFFVMVIIVWFCGSLYFFQVNAAYLVLPWWVWHVLFVAFLWKLGGPGFYFFKLEIYQWLPVATIYSFSIFSVFLACFFLGFFFFFMWGVYNSYGLQFLCYVAICNLMLLLRGLYFMNFYQYWGCSSINSLSFLMMLLLS